MNEENNAVSEPTLPDPSTWESGIQQAHDLATQVVEGFDATKTVLKVNPEDRKGGMYTPEELKLAVGMIVARRMIVELKADLMFNTMAVSRARNYMASHPLIPKHEKDRVMGALQVKEGMGVRLSTAWRLMELGLKQWQVQKFWHPGRDPVKEARKLFLAINGLEEVKQPTEVQSGNEDKGQEEAGAGGGHGGHEADVRGQAGEDQVGGQGPREEGEGSVPPAEGAGRGHGTPEREDQDLQGVQEAPGQVNQGEGGQDCCHPPRA